VSVLFCNSLSDCKNNNGELAYVIWRFFLIYQLDQCFSTSVPRRISVPWASSRCATNIFLAYFSILTHFHLHLTLFNTKIRAFMCCLSNILSYKLGVPQKIFEYKLCRQLEKVENHWIRRSLSLSLVRLIGDVTMLMSKIYYNSSLHFWSWVLTYS